MARSKSKLIYLHRSQFKRFLFNKIKRVLRTKKIYNLLYEKTTSIRPFFLLWKRAANVTNHYINNKIALYNGRLMLINDVKYDTKGYKFGELINTRKRPNHAGKVRQKQKVKKRTREEKVLKYTAINYKKQNLNKKKK